MRRVLPWVLAVLAGLALVGPFCFHLIGEADAGWHLAVGRLIAHGHIPFRNALTWTAPEEPWYATSWLYDWLAAAATERFGLAGLQSVTLTFVVLTLLVFALAFRRVNPRGGFWIIPAAALALVPRIVERPHVASWVILGFVLWLCLPAFDAPRDFRERARLDLGWQRRLACVPLIALFSNLHSGVAFPAVALVLFCAEAFVGGGRRPRELAIAFAGLAALAANPGGLFNLLYIVQHIHVRDVVDVVEMQTPKPSLNPAFYVALPIGLFAAAREWRRSPALLATVVVYAGLGLRAQRFVAEYELVTAVALVQALASVTSRRGMVLAVGIPVLAAVGFLVAWTPDYKALRFGHDFDAKRLPVHAAVFVEANRLAGHGFNSLKDGGYLEWAVPEVRWFQDARLQAFPESFFQREREAEQSDEGFRRWLDELGVEWAITARQVETMAGYTQLESREWALVYWDDASEIYLRRDVPRFAGLISSLEYKLFRPNSGVSLAGAGIPELLAWDQELRRFEDAAPDDSTAAAFHCAVIRRLGGESAATCQRGDRLANTDALRAAMAHTKEIQPIQ